MQPGDVLGDRFVIEGPAGAGGMGEVFRARDRVTGEAVAVKVLRPEHAAQMTRFRREAKLLAQLSHEGIVRYVAHGIAPSCAPYLVMEWLEGEDLGALLRRRRLEVDEAMTILSRAAAALAAVHARGVVHRDLKPGNLFLVGGDIARLKLLDFGVAWQPDAIPMTGSGVVLGTPAYMAPEQIRSGKPVDARADVYALGCVLFECLTGQIAFAGTHFLDVMAKIAFHEVPRVRTLRPEVPPALDALCARMLNKQPDERPRDGAAVQAELEAMKAGSMLLAAEPARALVGGASSLTGSERRVRSVVLMGAEPRPDSEGARPEAETQMASAPEAMRREAAACGGELTLLADGSILGIFAGAGLATDQAAQAARCALSMRAHAGGRPMVLVTGMAERSERLPESDLVDRAIQTMAQALPARSGVSGLRSAPPIAIDEVTAGLLDARFEVADTEAGVWLCGEQAIADGARLLLGKPTACVGRDWEIAALEALLDECVEESRARAALVTAEAGMGKTRVAYELLGRVCRRGAAVTIWIGRGDPLRAGAPLGLLGQALGGACGIQDGEPIEARRSKLRARVGERVGAVDARRVAEFLGELVGTPFPDEDGVQLRAARADARLMGDQMRRAWVDFIGAESAGRPLLLVLEDLHWGDLPTVQYVDEALRRVEDRPWMLLALARPEVHERFPGLWAGRGVQEIRLKSLSSKASARLVRQALGENVIENTINRLVAQADGNAFYLEELIRATAEGSVEALPETVLAMVQSRFESLDEASRRLLRAGSVFGDVFWRGAVEALLGGAGGASIEKQLERLEQMEWISVRGESRYQGEQELAFRHALVREAAYGMLTEEDRALGHRLAGEWLERVAEPSAAVVAEHFDRGGEAGRAAELYRRAAAQALAANDLAAVLARTERALALGASGEVCGEILLLRAEAYVRRGDMINAAPCVLKAIALSTQLEVVPKNPALWYDAMNLAGRVLQNLVQHDRIVVLADELAGAWTEDQASAPAVVATAAMAVCLWLGGMHDRAEDLHTRIDAVAEQFRDDPTVSGTLYRERAIREFIVGDPGACPIWWQRAIECYERAGDLYRACGNRVNFGFAQYRLGAYAEAVAILGVAVVEAERMGLDHLLGMAWHNYGLALCELGAVEEARAVEAKAITFFAAQGNRRFEGVSRGYLARILLRAGALAEAESEARCAVGVLEPAKEDRVQALAILASVLLARRKSTEALEQALDAMALLASLGKVHEGEALARVVYAEALEATGDHAAACAAIADARDRLLATAARIDDPRWRDSFLRNVPENARTLELARAWLGEDSA